MHGLLRHQLLNKSGDANYLLCSIIPSLLLSEHRRYCDTSQSDRSQIVVESQL